MDRNLYSEGKDIEQLEQESFTDQSKVVFNLFEDILCLKEDLQDSNDMLDTANSLLERIYNSGVKLDELESPLRKYLVGECDEHL